MYQKLFFHLESIYNLESIHILLSSVKLSGCVVFARSLVKMADTEIFSSISPTTNDCKKLIPALKTLFESMQMNFEQMFSDFKSEFFAEIRKKDEEIAELRSEVSSLKTIVNKLEDQLDDNDAYERRDTLIFSGSSLPNFQQNENCPDLLRNIIKDNLNIVLPPDGISACHRLGSKSASQRPDTRPIIAKFCQRSTKNDILSAARKLRRPQFFANESLTPPRQTIAYVLREAKKEFPNIISGCSTRDGHVCVWMKPPNPDARAVRHNINNKKHLEDFCRGTLKKPLSYFTEWTH